MQMTPFHLYNNYSTLSKTATKDIRTNALSCDSRCSHVCTNLQIRLHLASKNKSSTICCDLPRSEK